MKHIFFLCMIMASFISCVYGMQPKLYRTLSKDSKVSSGMISSYLQPLTAEQLSGMEGDIVLLKKNERSFYKVILGGQITGTNQYKVYQAENAGVVCSLGDLYEYRSRV